MGNTWLETGEPEHETSCPLCQRGEHVRDLDHAALLSCHESCLLAATALEREVEASIDAAREVA